MEALVLGAATPYPIRRAVASAEQRRQQVTKVISLREAILTMESTYARTRSKDSLWEAITTAGVELPTVRRKVKDAAELEAATVLHLSSNHSS